LPGVPSLSRRYALYWEGWARDIRFGCVALVEAFVANANRRYILGSGLQSTVVRARNHLMQMHHLKPSSAKHGKGVKTGGGDLERADRIPDAPSMRSGEVEMTRIKCAVDASTKTAMAGIGASSRGNARGFSRPPRTIVAQRLRGGTIFGRSLWLHSTDLAAASDTPLRTASAAALHGGRTWQTSPDDSISATPSSI
jgi:hypothetical protein